MSFSKPTEKLSESTRVQRIKNSVRVTIRQDLRNTLEKNGLSSQEIARLFQLYGGNGHSANQHLRDALMRLESKEDPSSWINCIDNKENLSTVAVHLSGTDSRVREQFIHLIVWSVFKSLYTTHVVVPGDFNHRIDVVKNSDGTQTIRIFDKEIGKDGVIFEFEILRSLSAKFVFQCISGPVEVKCRNVCGQPDKSGKEVSSIPVWCFIVTRGTTPVECRMTAYKVNVNNSLEVVATSETPTTTDPLSYIPGFGFVDHLFVKFEVDGEVFIVMNLHGEKVSGANKSCLYNSLEYGNAKLVKKYIQWMKDNGYRLPKKFLEDLQTDYFGGDTTLKTFRKIGKEAEYDIDSHIEFPVDLFLRFLEYCRSTGTMSVDMISFFIHDIKSNPNKQIPNDKRVAREIVQKFYEYYCGLIDFECQPFIYSIIEAFERAYNSRDNAYRTTEGMADTIKRLICDIMGDHDRCTVAFAEFDSSVASVIGIGSNQFTLRPESNATDGTACMEFVKDPCGIVSINEVATTDEVTDEVTVEATDEATGEVTVEATVEATDEVTVEATDEVTVEATDEVTGEATVEATVEATDEVTGEATVEATDEVTGEATVEATGEELDI